MADKRNEKLLKVAAVLFFVCFLAFNLGNNFFYQIIYSVPNGWEYRLPGAMNLKAYLAYLAFILVPIGLLAQKKGIITAGCVLSVVFWALYLFDMGAFVFRYANPVDFFETESKFKLIWLCDFFIYYVPVIWFILVVAGFNSKRESAAVLFFVCAVLMALAAFFHMGSDSMLRAMNVRIPRMIERYIYDWERLFSSQSILHWSSYAQYVFPALGSVFGTIGCVLCGVAYLPRKKASLLNAVNQVQYNASNKIERITNLKSLLDQGIISQEDFDKKKQEIINS